jgi:hypothetical protein
MKAADGESTVTNPKHRIRKRAETYHFISIGMLVTLHQAELEWFQRTSIELAATLEIRYR